MKTAKEIRANMREEREILNHAISSMKKSMNDFQDEKRTEWKSFKERMHDEVVKVENTLRNR
jgi:hypothetical protein